MNRFFSGSLNEDHIRAMVNTHVKGLIEDPFPEGFHSGPPSPAAVLVPLLRTGDIWEVLFILRSIVTGDMHSGQVAFPGGRTDPTDHSPEETALREAYEEINLDPHSVNLIGRLSTMRTVSNYLLTPVVGILTDVSDIKPDGKEVTRVFTIPLSWLADSNNYEVRERVLPAPFLPVPIVYFSTYDGELLWGVSARITVDLLQALHFIS